MWLSDKCWGGNANVTKTEKGCSVQTASFRLIRL